MVGKQGMSIKENAIARRLETLHNKSAELNIIEAELLKATRQLSILKRQAKQTQALYEQAKQEQVKFAKRMRMIKAQVDETGKIVVGLQAQLSQLKRQASKLTLKLVFRPFELVGKNSYSVVFSVAI